MRALVISPDFTELPGLVGEALTANGIDIEPFVVVPQEHFEAPNIAVQFPAAGDYDLVVVLGAPWGAWDDTTIGAWLDDLLGLLRTAQDEDVPVLGICFGGQALARALGGSVAPGPVPEIGWHEVNSDRPDLVPNGPWFQWHYDRLTPPPTSTEIARNDIASQAFVIGRSLGVQFHPELDRAELQGWLDMGGHGEAMNAGFDPDVLVSDTEKYLDDAKARTHQLVREYLHQIARLV